MSEYDDLIESGEAYLDSNDYESAMTDFSKAIELDPHAPDAYFYKGNVIFEQDDYDAAIAEYTKAIEIDPDSPGAYMK
jgi:tetratricopeptide (TPR) repeat protein